jgi:hypothetical protein
MFQLCVFSLFFLRFVFFFFSCSLVTGGDDWWWWWSRLEPSGVSGTKKKILEATSKPSFLRTPILALTHWRLGLSCLGLGWLQDFQLGL